ncbi:hypothetical protein TorRG33x02_099200 [Trema orientale]|uniref:Uncharacterized protein n=1 Tax=Trema orientale TaxID=63057 RepID=A0A2P5F8Q8_TREOI|nr:hypothetical protein TorRG33x02_099200 [Trema orientale]
MNQRAATYYCSNNEKKKKKKPQTQITAYKIRGQKIPQQKQTLLVINIPTRNLKDQRKEFHSSEAPI